MVGGREQRQKQEREYTRVATRARFTAYAVAASGRTREAATTTESKLSTTLSPLLGATRRFIFLSAWPLVSRRATEAADTSDKSTAEGGWRTDGIEPRDRRAFTPTSERAIDRSTTETKRKTKTILGWLRKRKG